MNVLMISPGYPGDHYFTRGLAVQGHACSVSAINQSAISPGTGPAAPRGYLQVPRLPTRVAVVKQGAAVENSPASEASGVPVGAGRHSRRTLALRARRARQDVAQGDLFP